MKTAIKDRGIIFGAESVRAILAGTKTQTRRVVNPQPKSSHLGYMMMENGNALQNGPDYPDGDDDEVTAPFRVGQRLWVRETWEEIGEDAYWYKADGEGPLNQWHSPIHMRRSASRITLEVTAVRVERLQQISEGDAIKEGCVALPSVSATANYRLVWNKINGKKYPWSRNPWVWVIEFRRVN